MSARVRAILISLAAAFLLVVGLFGAVRWLRSGEILGSVVVAGHGVELSGLTPGEADEILAILQEELAISPVQVQIDGEEVSVLPQQLGFAIDRERMVEAAMQRGREGGVSDQFRWWLGSILRTDEIPVLVLLDEDAVEAVLATWDVDVVGNPPVPGGVAIEGT
ncbi:MAG: hypothetical protein ACLGHX_03405, partial [Acidimicrobiia bacterium]